LRFWWLFSSISRAVWCSPFSHFYETLLRQVKNAYIKTLIVTMFGMRMAEDSAVTSTYLLWGPEVKFWICGLSHNN
jgi:hypothetical protein